jgi:hypothetical protein
MKNVFHIIDPVVNSNRFSWTLRIPNYEKEAWKQFFSNERFFMSLT